MFEAIYILAEFFGFGAFQPVPVPVPVPVENNDADGCPDATSV